MICRSSITGGESSEVFAKEQLLQTVSKLCEIAKKLSEKVENLSNGNIGSAVSQQATKDQLSAIVSQDCREMGERRRRISSIVIRDVL